MACAKVWDGGRVPAMGLGPEVRDFLSTAELRAEKSAYAGQERFAMRSSWILFLRYFLGSALLVVTVLALARALVVDVSVIECFETDGGVNYRSDRLI